MFVSMLWVGISTRLRAGLRGF